MNQSEIDTYGYFSHYSRSFSILEQAQKGGKKSDKIRKILDQAILTPILTFDQALKKVFPHENIKITKEKFSKEIKKLETIAKNYNQQIKGLERPNYDLALKIYIQAEQIFEEVGSRKEI